MKDISVRTSALNPNTVKIPGIDGECLQSLFDRMYNASFPNNDDYKQYFEILVNGHFIPKKDWAYTFPNKDDDVLIAVVPKGGDSRDFMRTALIITAVAAASYYTGSASWGVKLAAQIGATWAGTELAFALIPPVDIGDTAATNIAQSQTYSISGQSNTISKYGVVPRVYGSHKMFPKIAANPYIEFKSENGNVVQYLYAVYDFGIGPLSVSNLKIGDTPITDYTGVNYNFIDFNKPLVSEGSWDAALVNTLQYYKGDVTQINTSAVLNSNETDVGALPENYLALRSATENTYSKEQEITIFLTFPQGLNTFSSDGQQSSRNVEFEITFAESGSSTYRSFNNEAYVYKWEMVGEANLVTSSNQLSLYVPDVVPGSDYGTMYTKLIDRRKQASEIANETLVNNWGYTGYYGGEGPDPVYDYRFLAYGIPQGGKVFYSEDVFNVGTYVSAHGVNLGPIASVTTYSGSILKYTLSQGVPRSITVFSDYKKTFEGSLEFLSDYRGYDKPYPEISFILSEASSGGYLVTGNTTNPAFFSLKFWPKTTNSIDIQVKRVRSYGGSTYRITEDCTWSSLTTRFTTDPIITDKRHVFLELEIKATDQLSGNISNLSGVCNSVLDVYDGSSWVKEETNNPAWVFADILTGNVNKKAIAKSRLDTASLLEWAAFCDEVPTAPTGQEYSEPRFSCNFILDYNVAAAELLTQITSACQASLTLYSGKYGVLIDKNKTTPVQVFTNRNSWGFASTRAYISAPHAIKVKYIDPATNWEQNEAIVYDNGYTASTAIDFEEIDTFGCTNPQQAWRYGRFLTAQSRLRKEAITITVDFENLVCTRGDYVLVQQDVMKVGGKPVRVTNVTGNVITINDQFETEVGEDYGYTVRQSDGSIITSTMTINTATTATVDGTVPAVGDLLVWGIVDSITIDAIVKSIAPNSDLSATLDLVERAAAIYDAESTTTLPEYDSGIIESSDGVLTPPSEVGNLTVEENSWECSGGGYRYYVSLSWESSSGIVSQYEVYVNDGTGLEFKGFSTKTSYTYYLEDTTYLGVEHEFKVLGVSASGNKLSLGEVTAVTATPESKSTAPSDITSIYSNILQETLQLDWEPISDCDLAYYRIRYSPNLNALWSNSIPLQQVGVRTSLISVQARTGTYLVKAVDWNGNESENAASVITSIPELVNLNVIETTNDFPSLPGSFDRVQSSAGALILQEETAGAFYSEGFYEYYNLLDLGEIYSVRLQSLVDAEGYAEEDIIANWTSLSTVDAMATASVSDWDVETQYRSTDELNVIANWTSLDSVSQLSSGVSDNYTEWRKFTIGDFTGRVFQFRLRLVSNKANISPRVFDGIIKADMPDRVISYDNITIPAAGKTFTYSPAFKGPSPSPAISITIENAQSGDYWSITSKNLEGFVLTIYDGTDTAVERIVDIIIKGYGRVSTVIL